MNLERDSLLNNRYRIVEILGQGGMGAIYRAVDENLGMEVAVKENLFTTDEYARQFRREALILANLRHPNLPRVTDHFVIEGQGQYLVMDYIEGEDLRERMERVGVLPDEEVVVIGATICEALSYLHARKPPVVHRDIKPGNVKISPMGHITLVDFGLAKVVRRGQVTTTGARAMTPGYSPPEQYGTARTDHRTDIFSLGATLYVALTGVVPEDALARAMGQDKLKPVRKHNPRVSRRLAGVVEKALELRPGNRYQSAEELQNALLKSRGVAGRRGEGELIITPPPATPPSDGLEFVGESRQVAEPEKVDQVSPSPSGSAFGTSLIPPTPSQSEPAYMPVFKPRKLRRLGCWLTVILAGVLIGSFIWVYVNRPVMLDATFTWVAQFFPPSIVPAVFESLSTVPSLPVTVLDTFTPSPTNIQEPTDILTPALTSTPTATIEPTDTTIPTETPRPTGTPVGGGYGQIAFASAQTGLPQIWLMNADGTGKHQITDLPDGACQPSWSPNGDQMVFISPCASNQEIYPGTSLFIINFDGTGLTSLPSLPGGDFDPAWSPDGSHIALTSLRDYNRAQVYAINLADNFVQSLSANNASDSQPAWSPNGDQIAFVSTRRGPFQIWKMSSDGSAPAFLSGNANLKNTQPAWSPDGQVVLFTQFKVTGGIPGLMVARIVEEPVSENRLVYDLAPRREADYSPDGSWIAFESWPDGTNHDIYVMTIDGLTRQRLTTDPALDFDPAWRPVSVHP